MVAPLLLALTLVMAGETGTCCLCIQAFMHDASPPTHQHPLAAPPPIPSQRRTQRRRLAREHAGEVPVSRQRGGAEPLCRRVPCRSRAVPCSAAQCSARAQSVDPPLCAGAPRGSAVWNELFSNSAPLAIAQPRSTADVATAVRCALAAGVRVTARSGGCSFMGYSVRNATLTIDLNAFMNNVKVAPNHASAVVGAGARWEWCGCGADPVMLLRGGEGGWG